MFNPDLNPYVSKLEEHRDVISTLPVEANSQFTEFVNVGRPLIIDLGCGAGNFLRDYAQLRPDAHFIGFELRFKRLVKGAIKLKKWEIPNVRLVQAKAEDIQDWIPEDSVEEIHVNFPDPWPKKRHQKHRLISERFLVKIHRLLIDKGCLILKTDHKDYFDWAFDQVKNSSLLEISAYSEDLHQSEYSAGNIMTEFESLFKGKGFPVYYFRTIKR